MKLQKELIIGLFLALVLSPAWAAPSWENQSVLIKSSTPIDQSDIEWVLNQGTIQAAQSLSLSTAQQLSLGLVQRFGAIEIKPLGLQSATTTFQSKLSKEMRPLPSKDWYQTEIKNKVSIEDIETLNASLQAQGLDITIIPNYNLQLFDNVTPNDPFLASQNVYLELIDIQAAWNVTTQNTEETLVAIVDTGVDYSHPDLTDRIYINAAEAPGTGTVGVDDDGNGYIDDYRGWNVSSEDNTSLTGTLQSPGNTRDENDPRDDDGHGTHVAGLVAATFDNGVGIAGVAGTGNVKIVPIRIMRQSDNLELGDIIQGLDYAAVIGADVINMSLGGSTSQLVVDAYKSAFSDLAEAGILVLAAAGNGDQDGEAIDIDDNFVWPAVDTNTIAVGAVDKDGNWADFSNYGDSLDIVAPGTKDGNVGVLSTYSYTQGQSYIQTYAYLTGTSMATPIVAGVAALLRNKDPELHTSDIGDLLLSTTSGSSNLYYGNGLVNASTAMSYLDADVFDDENNGGESVAILSNALNSPNPFSPSDGDDTDIHFYLAEDGDIKLEIYSMHPKKILSVSLDGSRAGYQYWTWNGKDAWGDIVPKGVYVVVISTTGSTRSGSVTHKIVAL